MWVFTKRILFFGRNSAIHGLSYFFQENASFVSRLFWMMVLIASSVCLYLMLVPVAQLGVEINYTPDTLYLDWATTFPAVTVCEVTDTKLVVKKLNQLYPNITRHLNYDYHRYLSDLVFARGSCKSLQCEPCGKVIPCDVPWRHIVENVHKKCTELLSNCSRDDHQFPCCDFFKPVNSEHGTCYSFNTLQHKNIEKELLYVVNRSTGPGMLSFRLLSDAEMGDKYSSRSLEAKIGEFPWLSIHSTEELSTNDLDVKLKYMLDTRIRTKNRFELLFSVVEIENDPFLLNQQIDVRRCRYLHEVPHMRFHTYPVYSYGACQLAYRTLNTFKKCGCVHPVRDISYKDLYCNYTGLNCLATYQAQNKLDDENHQRKECLPSCVESEITAIHHSERWVAEDIQGTLLEIKMLSLPTIRYQRNLLRTELDIVVSVAGIVGLFFSASILSFVEIFYLLFRSLNK